MIKVTDGMKNLVDEELGDIDTGYYHWKEYRDETITGIIKLHEANKPKPEPVAWLVRRNGYENVTVSLSKDKTISYRHEVQMRSDLSGDLNEYRIEPLYTAQPPREPLSKDEINNIVFNLGEGSTLFDFARLLEQAHEIGVTNDQP